MEPCHEEKPGQEPRPEAQSAKPRRFRVVKLEERIAPSNSHSYPACPTVGCVTLHPGHCK
jgi:hypothetical protein